MVCCLLRDKYSVLFAVLFRVVVCFCALCLLCVVRCSLCGVRCLVIVVRWLIVVICSLMVVLCCLVFVGYCVFYVARVLCVWCCLMRAA